MALWGNNDSVGAAGSVTLNYATRTVTGGAGSGVLGSQFGETGQIQEGDVLSFGVKTKPGVFFGDAVVVSIASTTSLTIGSTGGLSGAAIAATTFQASQQPKFSNLDSKYSERNSDYSSHVYGIGGTSLANASGGQYATGAGWVGVQTYVDSGGNLRVKKEILVAMSGIATGNAPVYPEIATAN